MYKQNVAFERPKDNVKIWRYMDFSKLLHLLDNQALYFSSVENLGDKFEGSLSKANLQPDPLIPRGEYDTYPLIPKELSKAARLRFKDLRKIIYVNCWHMNEDESAAMWKLYIKSDEGIAIQSTFNKLVNCFNDYEHDVFIGKIKYVNYDIDRLPISFVFYPSVHKRKSFECEKELRAAILNAPPMMENGFDFDFLKAIPGMNVPINLHELIENIYVSPTSPEWFEQIVQSVLQKYNINIKVKKSNLSEDPFFN